MAKVPINFIRIQKWSKYSKRFLQRFTWTIHSAATAALGHPTD